MKDKFHTDVYYKRDGVYKYTTTMGGTNSVYAYKPTKHKIDKCKLYGYSYLKNKEVKCDDWRSIRREEIRFLLLFHTVSISKSHLLTQFRHQRFLFSHLCFIPSFQYISPISSSVFIFPLNILLAIISIF